MTNLNELNRLIEESGLKLGYIADRIGCTIESLRRKRIGASEFTIDEARELSNILHLTAEQKTSIFLP